MRDHHGQCECGTLTFYDNNSVLIHKTDNVRMCIKKQASIMFIQEFFLFVPGT